MNQEQVMREFSALPPMAQQEVIDFITFLRIRYAQESRDVNGRPDLRDEPFVGMWRDRTDMTDSSEWVRTLRKHEWG
ncbi:MAG: DUF2281 domain-containing protein [Anaerolineae bacterium]